MSKFDDCIQSGDKVIFNEDLGCRVNLSQLNRVANRSDIKNYITRAVPDIARKCGCKQDEVWQCMHEIIENDRPRWEIIDPIKAKEAGISYVSDGILAFDAAKIDPTKGFNDYLSQMEQKGYIKLTPSKLLHRI